MEFQQIITMGIVLVATLYLGRRLVHSVQDLFSSAKSAGCGGGCAKCEFAKAHKQNSLKVASAGAAQRIAISDIQMAPRRKQTDKSGEVRSKLQ